MPPTRGPSSDRTVEANSNSQRRAPSLSSGDQCRLPCPLWTSSWEGGRRCEGDAGVWCWGVSMSRSGAFGLSTCPQGTLGDHPRVTIWLWHHRLALGRGRLGWGVLQPFQPRGRCHPRPGSGLSIISLTTEPTLESPPSPNHREAPQPPFLL